MSYKTLRFYPFSILTFVAVCVLSLMPFPEIEIAKDVPLADKWTHFVMYGFLTLVVLIERKREKGTNLSLFRCSSTWLLILSLILLGGALELLQEYATATRSGEWLDWLADSVGVGIGVGIKYCLSRYL